VRCQHIRRWERPRSLYPEGRIGYLKWRKDLGRFHAETAAAILRAVGYDEALIARVGDLNLKRALTSDPEAQTVEDVLCLSFIEHELAAFAKKHPEQKIVEIIQKTWRKMSERAQALALQIPLSSELEAVVLEALKTG
jgi:HD superfamily phosphodiesterase